MTSLIARWRRRVVTVWRTVLKEVLASNALVTQKRASSISVVIVVAISSVCRRRLLEALMRPDGVVHFCVLGSVCRSIFFDLSEFFKAAYKTILRGTPDILQPVSIHLLWCKFPLNVYVNPIFRFMARSEGKDHYLNFSNFRFEPNSTLCFITKLTTFCEKCRKHWRFELCQNRLWPPYTSIKFIRPVMYGNAVICLELLQMLSLAGTFNTVYQRVKKTLELVK